MVLRAVAGWVAPVELLSAVATIVAGDNPPALSAGQGNLDITVPATSGDMTVAGLESARFLQSDGTVNIDLAASFAGKVYAIRVPR